MGLFGSQYILLLVDKLEYLSYWKDIWSHIGIALNQLCYLYTNLLTRAI